MKKTLIMFVVIFLTVVCYMGLAGDKNTVNAATPSDSKNISVAQVGANLEAEDIVIRKRASMNFRVRVKNSGSVTARNLTNNLSVSLSIQDSSGNWVLLKQWKNIDKIAPGQTVSRDYFAKENEHPNLTTGNFTLKADIALTNPHGINISQASVTRTYPQDAIGDP
jgi:hypothetical protein